MTRWQKLLRQSVTTPHALAETLKIDPTGLEEVCARYPLRINPYFLALAVQAGPPLLKQVVPDPLELADTACIEDPLAEEDLSPVPNLVHKYPDRVLFLVHSQCAAYCRFCTRKRKVGTGHMQVTPETIRKGIDYIRATPAIRDVLLSGGDPLLLPDQVLAEILSEVRRIRHVEIIRIGSRAPCTLPMRITKKLSGMLKGFHPLYINTHFNHPAEITPEAARALTLLADAGIPLSNQTVLLKGINDDPLILAGLFRALLRHRVRPYYLFQADMSRGTDHFRTRVQDALLIMRQLIGHVSGMAVPTLAVDAPGGGGKIPLTPDYVTEMGETVRFTNYQGVPCTYLNPA